MTTPATFSLFVYGTLKKGGKYHPVLANEFFVGAGVTSPDYLLIDLGEYPGMIRSPAEGNSIHGEIYRVNVNLLPELDRIEGAPQLFALQEIFLSNGETCLAYLFQGNKGVPNGMTCWPINR